VIRRSCHLAISARLNERHEAFLLDEQDAAEAAGRTTSLDPRPGQRHRHHLRSGEPLEVGFDIERAEAEIAMGRRLWRRCGQTGSYLRYRPSPVMSGEGRRSC
jgi:hypothetical protein